MNSGPDQAPLMRTMRRKPEMLGCSANRCVNSYSPEGRGIGGPDAAWHPARARSATAAVFIRAYCPSLQRTLQWVRLNEGWGFTQYLQAEVHRCIERPRRDPVSANVEPCSHSHPERMVGDRRRLALGERNDIAGLLAGCCLDLAKEAWRNPPLLPIGCQDGDGLLVVASNDPLHATASIRFE